VPAIASVKQPVSVYHDPGIPPDDPARASPSTPPSRDLRASLTQVLPLALGCLLGQLLPTLAQMPGFRLHVLWIPGPLLLGWLLFTPRAAWRTCVLSALAGTVLAFVLVPFVVLPRLLASAAEFASVVAVAWLLLRWRGARAPLEGYREIGLFVLLGCVLLPIACAWWQSLLFAGGPQGMAPGALLTLVLCSSVSYLLIVPPIVNLARIVQRPERRHGGQWQPVIIAITLLGMQLSMEGVGPFAYWTPDRDLITAQVWTLCTGCALLFLGALSEQKLSNHLNLQQAYRRLGELTGRMLVVQEEERTRIARDLHDDVNQSLAAISICLSALRNQIPEAERHAVVELQEQLLIVSNDIRSISHELHPSILRFTGLASALDAFCIKRNARGALRVRCRIENPPRLSDDHELSLFRIVQEAVNNVDKHAHAANAHVLVGIRGGQMVLQVDDDGVGMAGQTVPSPSPGLGMISMEERARLLGGSLKVGPSPLGGTRIEVRFPMGDAAQDLAAAHAGRP